jgi:organic hydroperoxide reductase OsmC/OhrA
MSKHTVTIDWQRTTADFNYKTFDRTHTWRFSGGQTIQGSSAPAYYGNAALANPEEGLVAALSSCHMLTFLSIAALKGFVVESYQDKPEGELSKNEQGKTMISQITLHPKVVFRGDKVPDSKALSDLHHKAHQSCFVANSLLTKVIIEPLMT